MFENLGVAKNQKQKETVEEAKPEPIIESPKEKDDLDEVVKEVVENSFSGVLGFNILSVILNIIMDFILLLLVYRSIVKMLRIISVYKNLENSLNFK